MKSLGVHLSWGKSRARASSPRKARKLEFFRPFCFPLPSSRTFNIGLENAGTFRTGLESFKSSLYIFLMKLNISSVCFGFGKAYYGLLVHLLSPARFIDLKASFLPILEDFSHVRGKCTGARRCACAYVCAHFASFSRSIRGCNRGAHPPHLHTHTSRTYTTLKPPYPIT